MTKVYMKYMYKVYEYDLLVYILRSWMTFKGKIYVAELSSGFIS